MFGFHSDDMGGGEGTLIRGDYDEYFSRIAKYSHSQTWEPTHVSNRITAQSSQFIYSGIIPGPHGSLAISDVSKMLVTIRIKREFKEKIIDILRRSFDIHHLSMFPDIDGFSRRFGAGLKNYSEERW